MHQPSRASVLPDSSHQSRFVHSVRFRRNWRKFSLLLNFKMQLFSPMTFIDIWMSRLKSIWGSQTLSPSLHFGYSLCAHHHLHYPVPSGCIDAGRKECLSGETSEAQKTRGAFSASPQWNSPISSWKLWTANPMVGASWKTTHGADTLVPFPIQYIYIIYIYIHKYAYYVYINKIHIHTQILNTIS